MYRAFNLELPGRPFRTGAIEHGRRRMGDLRPAVDRALRACVREDGSLDGTQLRASWFPDVGGQIFVSHSHRDEETALGLAGWLDAAFGLTAFVDSGIWGNADDLLREIDERHCRNPGGDTFSYEKRNRSTAHVHALLSTALASMIDRSECVFFLNTGASVPIAETMDRTDSPWIFSEIDTANRIRRRSPDEHRGTKVAKGRLDERDLTVYYDLQLGGFADVSSRTLDRWAKAHEDSGREALDVLYDLVPAPPHADRLGGPGPRGRIIRS